MTSETVYDMMASNIEQAYALAEARSKLRLTNMRWFCPDSSYETFYPVEDPPGLVYCPACRRMHRLQAGEPSEEDKARIEEIRQALLAREEELRAIDV